MSRLPAKFHVIDDDGSVRASLHRLFRSVGCECETFASAEEFAAAVQGSDNASWAIADVHMPGMSGIELMNYLHGSNPQLQWVLITAFDDPQARQQAEEAGVVLLQKPFDSSTLLAAVHALPAPK